jgi:glucose-6-phosphate 1-dehydrogenase
VTAVSDQSVIKLAPLNSEKLNPQLLTTGYENLVYDCMNGDATLYKHTDTVEKGWEIVTGIPVTGRRRAGRPIACVAGRHSR